MIVKTKSIAKSKKMIVLKRNMYISFLATRPKQTLNVLPSPTCMHKHLVRVTEYFAAQTEFRISGRPRASALKRG